MTRFGGKSAVITGGASGIGRAIAEQVHREGGTVYVIDLTESGVSTVVDSLGERAVGRVADLRDRQQIRATAVDVLAQLGGVDALFNNAGVSDQFTPALETSDQLWDDVLGINLAAAFFLSRELLPSLIAREGAAIVNTGSVASVVGGAGGAAYTVSKHGLLGLTKSLAASYGPQDVRVNCVLPGAIVTGLTSSGDAVVEGADAAISATPAGRWASAEEVARVATFLASSEASFVHGSAYTVDGGWTLT